MYVYISFWPFLEGGMAFIVVAMVGKMFKRSQMRIAKRKNIEDDDNATYAPLPILSLVCSS